MNNDNETTGTDTSVNEGSKKEKVADKRKQSLYLPTDILQPLQEEAARLDRSLSWVVQRACKAGLDTLRAMPSMTDTDEE